LIELLRIIDSGEEKIDALIVCCRRQNEDGSTTPRYRQASDDPIVSAGLLTNAVHLILERD
jgi:hypothetical protein